MRGLSILPSLLILLPLFLLPLCYSATTDTIITGQSINQTQTITSSANKFQLGFTPSTWHNNNTISIAIWCKKDPNQVLVWVANTENPITDSSGAVFKIGNDGNLQLTDSKGTSHWSTDITSFGTSASTEAVLLDTGNLVLKRDNKIVWQSFDYPTDTLLPGMKLGLDLKTGKNWSLTSGSHALSMDSQGQILEWQDGALDWRGGYWNGDSFNGLPQMRGNKSIYSYSFFNNGTEIYFSYNSSLISRLLLDSTGRLEQYAFEENGETGFWNLSWSRTKSRCQDYSVCGAFAASTCMDDALTVSCSCLQGLEPLSPNDLSVGCWGKSLVECGKVFVPLEKMKLPDKGVLGTGDVSLQECERECVGNCSCVAYAVVNSKCLVWIGNLTDLQQYNGDGQGDVLHLRVSASAPGGSKNKAPVIAIVMAVLGSLLLVGGTFFCWRRARERGERKRKQELMLQDLGLIVTTTTATTVEGRENAPELPLLNLQTVSTATENFSIANKLGEGGFGPVYKGKLPKGQEIAVKRLSRRSSQGLEEFKNEVALIAKLQHKNLVRLLGCCVQEEEKMLIYEYMPNKSLDLFLFDLTKRAVLDWGKRFHIIEGIAQGLLYLHRHSRLRIIHRDLKASNILLDGDLNPKISDFGMARIFEGNQNQANTLRVVGTYGYMSPEYALDGRFSEKSDVFSFGVLLLEIISGKKNTGVYHFEQSMNLVGYAWRMWKERRGLELLDPSLDDSLHLHQVLKCIYIGLLCVQEDPGDRPTMSSIIFMLGSEIDISPTPKQPAFSAGKAPTETSLSSSRSRSSINDVTITRVEPR